MTKRKPFIHRAPITTPQRHIIVVPLSQPERNDTASEIYAVISRDREGNEGITGMLSADGWVPLVSCRMKDIDMLRPHLLAMAHAEPNVKFIVRKFGQAVDIETIEP